MKSGPIRISAYQQGWDDRGVEFRVEDLEKHGPGIIVDVVERNEEGPALSANVPLLIGYARTEDPIADPVS